MYLEALGESLVRPCGEDIERSEQVRIPKPEVRLGTRGKMSNEIK
jgi:hypothetical protein